MLAALWVGTVTAVDRSAERTDRRRLEERVLVAQAMGGSVDAWFAEGLTEARAFAAELGAVPEAVLNAAVARSLGRRHTFAEEAIVVDGRMRVLGASAAFARLTGIIPRACSPDETGRHGSDADLAEVVRRARPGGPPVLSRVLLVPGRCERRDPATGRPAPDPWIAAAAVPLATPGRTVVVLARPARALAGVRTESLGLRGKDAGFAVYLLDPGLTALEPSGRALVPPSRLVELAASGGARTARGSKDGGVERIAAVQPLLSGWRLVVEQDAGAFDLAPTERPSAIVASVLVGVFGVVFLIVAFFDVRRRRAHERAEIAKNAFFSVAGHELRTPLTSIKGFLDTMSARWSDLTDDQRRMLVDRMLPQARRLQRSIERMLVAASIHAQTHTHPQIAPLDVRGLLHDLAERTHADAPLHEVVLRVQRDLPDVQADRGALEQVLQHLVDNAVKYSPTGGAIRIVAHRVRRGVAIAVEDEGIGLPSDASRIFEALVQGEDVTKRVHDEGGIGVGLFIVRTLVEEMGGRVRAERLDAGSRFVVTLRAAAERTEAPIPVGD